MLRKSLKQLPVRCSLPGRVPDFNPAFLSTAAGQKTNRPARKLLGWMLGATAVAGGAATYIIQNDEGYARSFYFWKNALPIYLRYRYVQHRVEGLEQSIRDEQFDVLHDCYAKAVFDIVLTLKGFYIKLAQVGSTRPDILPKQYIEEAVKLQDQAPSIPVDDIISVIESSTGRKLEDLFAEFDRIPLGVASIGQAHRAVLHSGKAVVVKVQLPTAETYFRNDIKTIKRFCDIAQPQHSSFLEEIEKQFMTEFDYRYEAQNLLKVRNNLLQSPFKDRVVVPAPIEELCTKQVLVMEYLEGPKLIDGVNDHFATIAEAKGLSLHDFIREQQLEDEERKQNGLGLRKGMSSFQSKTYSIWLKARQIQHNSMAYVYNSTAGKLFGHMVAYRDSPHLLNIPEIIRVLLHVHGHEIFVDGCFNGDPHPGNILLLPEGKLGLIDYGQVKEISRSERVKLAKLVLALADGSDDDIVEALTHMNIRTKSMKPEVLCKLGRLFMDRDDMTVTEGENPQLFLEKLGKMDPIDHIPSEYVMAFRVSMLLRGFSYHLRYDVSHAEEWKHLAQQVIEEEEAH